ncbi:MAG: hypothetical protein LBH59_09975 [Planctomycetaceae bacterium]|jgi:hypothetical protein|nr:hypothetical protein [Planctomycetaceae bacterium]
MVDNNDNNKTSLTATTNNSSNVTVDNANNDNKTAAEPQRKYTAWHWGFSEAINWELRYCGCNFKDIQEYKINARSYLIDKLVILESLPVDLENASGLVKCLRHYTFFEYKSPNHTLTIQDIDRLMGLIRLHYTDINIENNNTSRNDIAAIFVVSRFPREALKELCNGAGLEKIEQGIYTRCTDNITMSIVVIPELDKETYKLLTSLKRELPIDVFKNLIDTSKQYSNDPLLQAYRNAYIYWLLEAHANKIRKGEIEMTSKLFMAIEKNPVGAEWLNNREAKSKAEGIAKGKAEGEAKGEAKTIIKILSSRLETPSAALQKQIMEVNDIDKLDELADFALTCVSLGEFATALN